MPFLLFDWRLWEFEPTSVSLKLGPWASLLSSAKSGFNLSLGLCLVVVIFSQIWFQIWFYLIPMRKRCFSSLTPLLTSPCTSALEVVSSPLLCLHLTSSSCLLPRTYRLSGEGKFALSCNPISVSRGLVCAWFSVVQLSWLLSLSTWNNPAMTCTFGNLRGVGCRAPASCWEAFIRTWLGFIAPLKWWKVLFLSFPQP